MSRPAAIVSPRAPHAFSLMELITVVAIISIVATLVISSVNGFGRSAALTTSGNRVVNLATLARQTAVSKNTMTALVLLANQGTDHDYRAFTVMVYDRNAGWSQVGEWELLPDGIVVDRNDLTVCSILDNSPQPFPFLNRDPQQTNPPVFYKGQQLKNPDGYAARIFLPTGALQNPEKSAQIRVVEGFPNGSKVAYTHGNGAGGPANYYDIAIIGLSGITKISRP